MNKRFLEFENKRLAGLTVIALFSTMLGIGMQAINILLYILPVLPAYLIGMAFGMLFMGVTVNFINTIFPEIFKLAAPDTEEFEKN